jgi:hypothetical protein
MEQPPIFYAVSISLALLDGGHGFNVTLAWTYVISRIVHSIYQAKINVVITRFWIFAFGSAVLMIMTARAAALVFL